MSANAIANPATKAALYLRISLDRTGEQLAVERQREECQRIAQQRGWTVVAEYVDNSISASDARKNRPGYDQLLASLDRGEFDALICYDLDRLTRQPRQLEDWIDRATENGLLLVTANGEADLSTDGGQMFARIKAAVARQEVDRKSARQTAANAQRAEKGRPPLGTRLTGYTSQGEVIEEEAKIIRFIFGQFNAGDSLKGIVRALNENGTPTRRGLAWHTSTLGSILRNPRYAGLAVYQGQETGQRGNWEPLVSESEFRLATARLNDPRRKLHSQGTDRKYFGSGLYRCSQCDGALQTFSNGRYRCNACKHSRSRDNVDQLVLAVLRARLAQGEFTDLLPDPNHEQATQLDASAKALHERLELIGQDYDAGLIDGRRYATAREKVLADLEDVDRQRRGLIGSPHGGAADVLTARDPVAKFEDSPLMVRRAVLDFFCTVRVDPAPRGRKAFDPESVHIEWRKQA